MTDCTICQIAQKKTDAKMIYEDDSLFAILHPKPASAGHVVLMPKEHYPILENLPNNLINHMFNIASKISSSIFDSLNVHGTNIFVQNGIPAGQSVPHITIHIIPRTENDNMNLMWQPKQIGEEEMSTVELKIKEQTSSITVQEEGDKPKAVEGKAPEDIKQTDGEENYLLKQLRRIP